MHIGPITNYDSWKLKSPYDEYDDDYEDIYDDDDEEEEEEEG